MDAAPFIQKGKDRTFVPVRFLGNALGVDNENITWDSDSQTATLRGNAILQMTVGKEQVTSNGVTKDIDVAPLIVNPGRTMLPAKYVAEGLGYEVYWDEATQTVLCWPKGEDKPNVAKAVEWLQEQEPIQKPEIIQPAMTPKPEDVFKGDTYVMGGYVLPENTDLQIRKTYPNNPHQVELEVLIHIKKPLDGQYNHLEGILGQKFDNQTVNEVMEYTKQKTDWKQDVRGKRWVYNGKTISVGSPGGASVVEIIVWDKVCPFK